MAVRAYNAAEVKADLYARIPADGELIQLLGDLVKGDVLPSWWQYIAASADADDYANGVMKPTLQTGNGRWIRQNIGIVKSWIDPAMATMQSDINGKFPQPTGNNTQYICGDGSTISFPSIPTNTNQLTNGAGFLTSVPAQSFASLTGKPTTLSGYGINDAYPLSGNPSGFLTSVPAQTWASITGKPTFATVATSGSYLDLSNRPTIKRQETYSGTTNASGNFTVTFGTAYAVAPNIQASITNQGVSNNQFIKVTSVSTTGFTVNVFQRSAVTLLSIEVLLAATTNVNGATVDCIVTEK